MRSCQASRGDISNQRLRLCESLGSLWQYTSLGSASAANEQLLVMWRSSAGARHEPSVLQSSNDKLMVYAVHDEYEDQGGTFYVII